MCEEIFSIYFPTTHISVYYARELSMCAHKLCTICAGKSAGAKERHTKAMINDCSCSFTALPIWNFQWKWNFWCKDAVAIIYLVFPLMLVETQSNLYFLTHKITNVECKFIVQIIWAKLARWARLIHVNAMPATKQLN